LLTDKLPSVSHAGSVQKNEGILNNSSFDAGVVELVDTPDLGSGGESRGGSSPFTRTKRVIIVNTRSRDMRGTE
tara:strand:+ start:140 stop:361 length:222 start_codon:yes stop_codon:yes gene_type:complete